MIVEITSLYAILVVREGRGGDSLGIASTEFLKKVYTSGVAYASLFAPAV